VPKLIAVVLLVVLSLGFTSCQAATLGGSPDVPVARVRVIEFYNPGLDHYFITADPEEIEALDNGTQAGWMRTGYQFGAFASTSNQPNLNAVCRFYGLPSAGLNSHFYSASPAECAAVVTKFSTSWQFESDDVFKIQMPDGTTGVCPPKTAPVYRVFNNRADANHRYTMDTSVRAAMIQKGAIAEGAGADGVAFCADASIDATSALTAMSVIIVSSTIAADTFAFSSSVGTSVASAVLAYSWNFGDGVTQTGATASHRFVAAGTYNVILTVSDNDGHVASATKLITVALPTDNGSSAPPQLPLAPPISSGDFDARKSAPGVVRWFDFDSAASLGPNQSSGPTNFGWFPGRGTNAANPVLDTTVKASGAGSLRFDLNSQTQSDGAGMWFANFSPDLRTQFGANSEFYVQMRVRWNQAFHDTVFLDAQGSTQGGIKFFDVGAGDQLGHQPTDEGSQGYYADGTPVTMYFTNTDLEQVVNTYYQTRIVQMYAYSSAGMFAPMNEYVGSGDYKLQPAMPDCLYSKAQTTGDVPGCFNFTANEWITLQLGITLGPKDVGGYHYTASRVRLWAAHEGQPSVLINDWRPTHDDGTPVGGYFPPYAGNPAYDKRYGKVNIFPYLTNKNATQAHATGQMWVDELIVSTKRIADPAAVAVPNAKVSLGPNTAINLGPYAPAVPNGENPGNSQEATAYSGMQYDAHRRQMVFFGGGHAASNSDTIMRLPLDTLTWTAEYSPTPKNAWTFDNYDFTLGAWKSGPGGPYPRPAARHTLDELAVVGDELIVLAKVEGNYANLLGDWSAAPGASQGADHYTNTIGRIAHYNFINKSWTFAPVSMPDTNFPAVSYDPPSGNVLILGRNGLFVYDPVGKTMARALDLLDNVVIHDENGTPVDASALNINQNLVYFPLNGKHYYLGNLGAVFEVTLNRTDVSKSTITKLTTTGTPPSGPEVGAAYDSVNNLIGVGPVNNVFYAFNPATKVWTSRTIEGGSPGSVQYHCIDYDPVNNAYIFINTSFDTWAYRYQ
jgi:PKD repeat protein